jgi:hypothetical protein
MVEHLLAQKTNLDVPHRTSAAKNPVKCGQLAVGRSMSRRAGVPAEALVAHLNVEPRALVL